MGAVGHLQLAEDGRDVVSRRLRPQAQPRRDRPVGGALVEEMQDHTFGRTTLDRDFWPIWVSLAVLTRYAQTDILSLIGGCGESHREEAHC